MVYSASFYRNCSTPIVSSPNILFCSFLPILFWIFQSHWFICSFYFRTFTTIFCFFCFRLLVHRFLRKRKMWNCQILVQLLKLTWMKFHWLQVLIPKFLRWKMCGVAKFMRSCWKLVWMRFHRLWVLTPRCFVCMQQRWIHFMWFSIWMEF